MPVQRGGEHALQAGGALHSQGQPHRPDPQGKRAERQPGGHRQRQAEETAVGIGLLKGAVGPVEALAEDQEVFWPFRSQPELPHADQRLQGRRAQHRTDEQPPATAPVLIPARGH